MEWSAAARDRTSWVHWGWVAAIAALYFGGAKLGLSVAFVAPQVSPVWPPTGIALAAILLLGYRLWPGVALGAFLANWTAQEPAATAAGIALGNTLEALAGAWLLRRVAGFRGSLERLREVVGLVVLAAALSTTLAATVGVTSLCLGGVASWSRFGTLWWVWWLGDALGALVIAPLLLAWVAGRAGPWPPRRLAELGALLLALVAVCGLVFTGAGPTPAPGPALEYTVFPFVIWAALRFGQRGATLVTFLIAAVAIPGTVRGFGPFALGTPHQSLVLLQVFMAVVAITGLFLAVAIAERNRVADRLAEADRRKDEFLAILGHELRNPLGAIKTALGILRIGGAAADPTVERTREVLERQTRHLTRLVGDLLDLARITRGDLPLSPARVDLRTVVAKAAETVQPMVEERRHRLSAELPGGALMIDADPVRIEQVVTNLLQNAAKYTPAGGRIRLSLEREPEAAVLRVEDDGIGMGADLLPRVFDLFVQGDRSLDRPEGGLGVGLTLVRRIVERHGGTIAAESDGPGRGSRFTVRLPAPPDGLGSPGADAELEVLRAGTANRA
jgi:signal transduction histidine kinase